MSKESLTSIPLTGPDFEAGMIQEAKQHGIDLEAYFASRDLQTVPPAPVQPHKSRTASEVIEEVAAPTIKLSALLGGISVVVVAAVSVAGAVMAFVSSNAALIGGGALAAAMLYGVFAGRGKEGAGPGNPGDGGKWEYYQKQEQGWRKTE